MSNDIRFRLLYPKTLEPDESIKEFMHETKVLKKLAGALPTRRCYWTEDVLLRSVE